MDDLNERIGVLTRREVEARVLAPLIGVLAEEFGREGVLAALKTAIAGIAHQQGKDLAARLGGNTLAHFARSLESWTKGNALEIEVREQTDEVLAFTVTRCRYAELYRALGIGELGGILSCGRDFAAIEGFNPNLRLERTRTIMEGAACCDFIYRLGPTGRGGRDGSAGQESGAPGVKRGGRESETEE